MWALWIIVALIVFQISGLLVTLFLKYELNWWLEEKIRMIKKCIGSKK